jgi:hypothetical protein
MAKITLDRGPAAQQAIPAAPAAVNNIGVSVADRAGPVLVRGVIECHNGSAASRTYTAAIRKNAVQVALTVQNIEVATLLRSQIVVEHVDLVATVGDTYTLEIDADAADAASVIEINGAYMIVEALSQDAALVAGIGPATA